MARDAIVEELEAVKKELERLRKVVEQKNAPRRAGRPDRPGTEKIQAVFETVKEMNPTLPVEKRWAFTKSLLFHSLKINLSAAEKFLEKHQDEIDQLHRDSNIDPGNHLQNKGNDLKALKQAIWEYTQIVTVHLPVLEAKALLQAGEEGLSHLRKEKKSNDQLELADQALDRLDEAIGEAPEDEDEKNSED